MAIVSHRLGLTGGIGSGKSTVATVFAQMGAAIIDADAISRAITASDGSAIARLIAVFGRTMLTEEGALDRDQMRRLVYSDPTAKARLEAIVHPLVGIEIAEQARKAALADVACIVFDIPLLVESKHWRARLDRILVIDCNESTQVSRVMGRSGQTALQVNKVIATQVSRQQRVAAADLVLYNEGITLDHLTREVHEIGAQFGL